MVNANCAVSVSLDDIDVVVEGTARKVTDMPKLERVANLYASLGWPAHARAGAITAEFSAPSVTGSICKVIQHSGTRGRPQHVDV